MTTATTPTLQALRHALEQSDWRQVKALLLRTPTAIAKQASAPALAASLELVRGAAGTLVEACSFSTAFEASFETRRALHHAGACEWARNALAGFAAVRSVVAAVSSLLALLGTGAEGREHVGKIGAVDQLTKLWHRYPDCVQIVSALVSLCPGHIDNVSRVMRRRGLITAMQVLRDPHYVSRSDLVENTLILVGMCAICTPDNTDEGEKLVPALMETLERLNNDRQALAAQHAILAVANIAECWIKEHEGYQFSDPERLIAAVIATWESNRTCSHVSAAASRALLAMLSSHLILENAIMSNADIIRMLASDNMPSSSTAHALHHRISLPDDSSKHSLLSTDKCPTGSPGGRHHTIANSCISDDEDEPDCKVRSPRTVKKKPRNAIGTAMQGIKPAPAVPPSLPVKPLANVIDLVTSSEGEDDSISEAKTFKTTGRLGKRSRQQGPNGSDHQKLLDTSPVTPGGTSIRKQPKRVRQISFKYRQIA